MFINILASGSVDATNTVIASGLAMSAAAFGGLFILADYFAGGALITPIRRSLTTSFDNDGFRKRKGGGGSGGPIKRKRIRIKKKLAPPSARYSSAQDMVFF